MSQVDWPGALGRFFAMAALVFSIEAAAQWEEPECETLVTAIGQVGSRFGDRLADLGDVDGDDIPDFAVGATFFNTNQGRVSVHSGADGSTIWSHTTGITSTILGFDLEVIDDVNDDGVRELLGAAPFQLSTGGLVFVYSGVDGEILHTFSGTPGGSSLGYSMTTGGDYDGDDVDDIAIGDTGHDIDRGNEGGVFIYSGDDFSLITVIVSPDPDAWRFGAATAFLPDVTGDGRDELIIGERITQNGPEGRLRMFSFDGVQSNEEYMVDPVNLSCAICIDRLESGPDLDGDESADFLLTEVTLGVVRTFSGETGAELFAIGDSASDAEFAPDVNGDGIGDIIVGERSNGDGATNAGRIRVHSGANGALIRRMTFNIPEAGLGVSVESMTDVDGDGVADVLAAGIGSSGNNVPGRAIVIAGIAEGAGDRAELLDIQIIDGRLIAGGIADLEASDDRVLHTEALVTAKVAEPHRLRMLLGAQSPLQSPDDFTITFEARISDVEASVWLLLRNWRNGNNVQVAQFTNGLQETVEVIDVRNAARFVRPADRRIELEIRKVVFFPFTLGGFNSFIDCLKIDAR